MSNFFSRERILIIGSDISMFHLYLKYQTIHQESEILGFVLCTEFDENPFISFFKGFPKTPLKVYKMNKLEKVIYKKMINKCLLDVQNMKLNIVRSIINKIIATGNCAIEHIRPQAPKMKSFKPVIVISSLAPHIGKTQLARYFCNVLNANCKKVAVIVPFHSTVLPANRKIADMGSKMNSSFITNTSSNENLNININTNLNDSSNDNFNANSKSVLDEIDINTMNRESSEAVLSEKDLINQYIFKDNDPIPSGVFGTKIEWEIEQFQKSGAFRIYVTNSPQISLIMAEQQCDLIIYDSYGCESPLIDAVSSFCVVTKETFNGIENKTLWPGYINLESSENIVYLSKHTNDEDTISKHFAKTHQKLFYGHTKYIPENSTGIEVFNHKVMLVDQKNNVGVSHKMAIENGAYEIVDPSPYLVDGLESRNCSIIADIDDDDDYDDDDGVKLCKSPKEDAEKAKSTMKKIAKTINNADADVVIVSLQRDISGIEPGKNIIYTTPEIQDHSNAMYNWLSRFFAQNSPPPLKKHFEAQVDILMSMAAASDKELFVSNNESANREAFCRLFLSSHLPPGFRVTTGEIIDCMSNITGQLDVVVVNDSCPIMTLDHSGSVIAPILADNVLSVIEVKTSLSSETLRKALSQLRPVRALMPTHGTLIRPDGQIIEDPLGGKIITGIFAFNPISDIEKFAPSILQLYPNVVDFVVTPEDFGFFSVEMLSVCGIKVRDDEVINGYVKYTARGIGLALIFGILNSIAATRRFSGSYCVKYLSGSWGGQVEATARYKEELEKSLQKIKKIISATCSNDLKSCLFRRTTDLLNTVEEIRLQV